MSYLLFTVKICRIISDSDIKIKITVEAETAKADDKTMTATITLTDDSVTEATITFELAGTAF